MRLAGCYRRAAPVAALRDRPSERYLGRMGPEAASREAAASDGRDTAAGEGAGACREEGVVSDRGDTVVDACLLDVESLGTAPFADQRQIVGFRSCRWISTTCGGD
jgi:hypothetical protein